MKIDRLDKAILMQLQRNNKLPNVEIAEKVGLSPPACLKRVKRLREMGAVISDNAILSPEILGSRIDVIFLVEMDSDAPRIFEQFSASMENRSEVLQCYQVTGESDFILITSMTDIEDLDTFSNSVLREDTTVKKFKTSISKKRNKFTTVIQF